jgi:type IV secretory pathway VirB3-like protein
MKKTESFLSGAFFGFVMGFVVFLIASSVVAYCIELCLHALSKIQVIFISFFDKRASAIYRYQSALRKHGRLYRKYRSWLIRKGDKA